MAYPSIAENPLIQSKIAAGIAAGHLQSNIALQLGTSAQTISKSVNLDSTRLLIEQARQAIINKVLPKAVENVQACVNHATSTDVPRETLTDKSGNITTLETNRSKDMRYWGLRYSEKLMESIGVMGSQTPSIAIQAVFNQQNVLVSPVIEQLLGLITNKVNDLPALDVEYEDK